MAHGVDRDPPVGAKALAHGHEPAEGSGGYREPGNELDGFVRLVVEAMGAVLGLEVSEDAFDELDVGFAGASERCGCALLADAAPRPDWLPTGAGPYG